MIIYRENNSVKSIKFCCGDMAEAILLRHIRIRPWTDYSLTFFMQSCEDEKMSINACPFCGSLIEEDVWTNSGEE